jgi:signal transduction histidine kinase
MSTTTRGAADRFDFDAAGCAYLADASRLLADTLDYESTLATVAALALPHLGSWCIVDVVESDGAMRRLAVVHPEPDKRALARRLTAGWPPELGDPLGVPVAVSTRRTQVVERVTDEMLVAAAHDDDNLRILRAMGIGSLVVVPMLARGHVHGAMTFVSPNAHHYGVGDLSLAEDLARRAAMAIDNARLYRTAEASRRHAEEASGAKSEFLAAMSHEMRTPLNAVLGYVDVLELELHGPLTETQRGHLERIRGSSAHLLALVEQALDLARLESGKLPVARETASLHEAVDGAVARALADAEAAGVRVADGCTRGRDRAYVGDPGRVAQALDHLLSNAVKFTAPGGTVRVACGVVGRADGEARVSGAGPWACVEVEDTGVGIAPDRLAQMFEPFRQGDGGHTRTEGGAGLGLTLARHLARLMGGDVTVRSAPGVGSCFTLWLPAAESEEADADREQRARRRSGKAIEAAGRELTCRVDEVAGAYLRRLRADPAVPHASDGTDVDLVDHASTLVADVAQSLGVLGGDAETAPKLLRDGSRIQRLVAELHAEQRRRLGWSEAELRRDFEILREVVEASVRAHLPSGEGADAAAAVVARLLRQTERISVQAYRAAAAHPA